MKFARKVTAVAVALSVMSPISAHAYPPGQNIGVSLSQSMVKPGTAVTASIVKAKPGSVSIRLGTVASSASAGPTGTASASLKPTKAGIYKVTITDTAATGNTTSTTLYVPSVTFPKPTKVGAKVAVSIAFAKPGTAVSIKVGSKTFKGAVGANSKLDLKITLPKKGANTITVNVGPLKSMIFTGKATGK